MKEKRKISKREYNQAVKVVAAYEQQVKKKPIKGEYQFLYWLTDKRDHRVKYIKAKSIEDACKKFIDKKPNTLISVDYEVKFGDSYIDISEIKVISEYVQ